MKRWSPNSPERQIEAFIGAWGIKTGSIRTVDDLLSIASTMFKIPISSGLKMAEQIKLLGPKARKHRAMNCLPAIEARVAILWQNLRTKHRKPLRNGYVLDDEEAADFYTPAELREQATWQAQRAAGAKAAGRRDLEIIHSRRRDSLEGAASLLERSGVL